ncbi:MAG TPA: hypothetical protein VGD45_28310 [Steroidobacter sp.]|uniref:hypothetical protein n=1 Tax=Steroidobacter sp. TaxID=1978227 RepID=UPI002EDA325E
MQDLQYFTHVVDGQLYGAWYRMLSHSEVEVMGVGLLEVVSYAGASPEAAAKSVLENSVRQQLRMGAPMPSLKPGLPSSAETIDTDHATTAELSGSGAPGEISSVNTAH